MKDPEIIQPREFSAPKEKRSQKEKGPERNPFEIILALLMLGLLGGVIFLIFQFGPFSFKSFDPSASETSGEEVASKTTQVPEPPPISPPPVSEPIVVDEPEISKVDPAPPSPEKPALSEAELAAGQKYADEAMSDLLDIQRKVEAMSPDIWGGNIWSNAVAEIAAGDAAYMSKDFDLATKKFRSASKIMKDVEASAPMAFDQLMSEGLAAVQNGDSTQATRLSQAALAISPESGDAQKLLARARTAEETFNHIRRASGAETVGQLELAYAAYSEALKLDPAFPGVAEAHERVREQLGSQVFKDLMSTGLAKYREGRLDEARADILEAKKIRPDLAEIDDTLRLIEDGIRLRHLNSIRDQAEKEEGEENFEQALALYNEALAIDPIVTFASEGRNRSVEKIRLEKQLDAYLAQPDLLFKDVVLREVNELLDEARGTPNRGPKLEAKIQKLADAVIIATTPVSVSVVSDKKTQVTLLRSGELGKFSEKPLSLTPGSYVFTGSRIGYRDVRIELKIQPGAELAPVEVICREKI